MNKKAPDRVGVISVLITDISWKRMNTKVIAILLIALVATSQAGGPFCSLCTKIIDGVKKQYNNDFSNVTADQLVVSFFKIWGDLRREPKSTRKPQFWPLSSQNPLYVTHNTSRILQIHPINLLFFRKQWMLNVMPIHLVLKIQCANQSSHKIRTSFSPLLKPERAQRTVVLKETCVKHWFIDCSKLYFKNY